MSFDAKKPFAVAKASCNKKKKNPSTNITAQKSIAIRPYE